MTLPSARVIWSELKSAIGSSSKNDEKDQWTHSNVKWKLEPPDEMPFLEKMKIKAAAKLIKAECELKGEPAPPILCPKGGQAKLVACDAANNDKPVAKFGIVTQRGPSAPVMDETIEELYGILPRGTAGIGAIKYMFVEPEYRGKGIGSLALEAIAAIHTVQGIDFTLLVADDDGSGKLIQWYKKNEYALAPKLQDILGSPDGKYGATMIRPTSVRSNIFADCKIQWW